MLQLYIMEEHSTCPAQLYKYEFVDNLQMQGKKIWVPLKADARNVY